jgi:hypothetical protein
LNDPVGGFVGTSVVISRRTHKAKVHEKFTATVREAFGRFPGRLFSYVGLLFKIDVSEWVVFENWGNAIDMVRQGVELALSG